MKYGRCALLSCTLVCIVALSCIEANGKSQRLNPEQLGAQPVSVGTSGRWLLASNETHLGREEEEICDLQPFASTPSYGIMRHIQTYLRMTATGPHKKLFPLSKGDIAGFVLTILVLFIAAGGGIGGGGAIIPLYILFIGFDTRVAVALGNITIVGGALSNFAFNVPRRHAFFNRPLIDWDLILVMEPATILGALIGGYLNKLFPNWLTTILLALLLTFISYKLVTRGIISWRSESAQRARQGTGEEGTVPLLQDQQPAELAPRGRLGSSSRISSRAIPRSQAVDTESHSPLAYTASLGRSFSFRRNNDDQHQATERVRPVGGSDTTKEEEERLAQLEEHAAAGAPPAEGGDHQIADNVPFRTETNDAELGEEDAEAKQQRVENLFVERRQLPPIRFGILFLLTAVVAASDYTKGIVRCSSWLYWVIVLAIVPVVLLVTFGGRNYLLKKRRRKQAAGHVWVEGDVDWNPVTTLTYPAISSFAGLVAGMFGVGGGIIKFLRTDLTCVLQGPLMLELGVLPDVASATSATMIVFTSASASIVFLSFGGIPMDYALAVFLLGVVFTMLGQVACYALMRLLARRSIIVFAMAALMVLSMGIVYYEAVVGTISAVHEDRLWRFGHLCGSH